MPVNFYLDKRPNRKGLCPILTSISIKGCRLLTSIGYSIPPERWDRKRMEMKRGAGTSDELPPSVVNSRIEEIRSVFRSFELNTRCRPSSETLKMMIADIKGESHPEGGGPTVMQCFTEYLKYGTTSRQWAEGSLKNNETLQRHLNGWEHQSFEDLIDDGCVSFLNYLRTKKMKESTVRKYFILIRSFLRWADLAGFCDYASSSATPKFRTIRNPVVFLTSDELERLFSFDISPGNEDLEKARDLFCFCCSTSLRYSDMAKLKVSDISGGQIKVVTKKTDTPIIIDLNRISSKILSKYHKCIFSDGLALPSMDLKHLNSNIKKVCRMCGINTPVTKTFYVAGERKDVTLPKWKLISSHCGRRTFICYALARGVPPQIVMKWTGHSDYKAMRPYIDVAGQDCAKAMKKLFRNFDEE